MHGVLGYNARGTAAAVCADKWVSMIRMRILPLVSDILLYLYKSVVWESWFQNASDVMPACP